MKFEMPSLNTCHDCGKPIKQGEPVFAETMDAVRAGKGHCAKCEPKADAKKEEKPA